MKWRTAQEDWIYDNYISKGIKPWICKCGERAFLHRTINGSHEFVCRDCYKVEQLELYGSLYYY